MANTAYGKRKVVVGYTAKDSEEVVPLIVGRKSTVKGWRGGV
jgi:hypothetical protein